MHEFTSPDAVSRQLTRILDSATFQGAARSQQALLRFLVQETVQGRSDRLKEYTLGAEGLGQGETFDLRTDPIVRRRGVAAARSTRAVLRQRRHRG